MCLKLNRNKGTRLTPSEHHKPQGEELADQIRALPKDQATKEVGKWGTRATFW